MLISTFVIVYTFSITLLLTLVASIAKRITNGKDKKWQDLPKWRILVCALILAVAGIDMAFIAFAIGDLGDTTLIHHLHRRLHARRAHQSDLTCRDRLGPAPTTYLAIPVEGNVLALGQGGRKQRG